MENEEYIESGLSVGAVKYVDPNEIITEEEYNYIKNKVPELNGRVGTIEGEIEEINSSLDNIATQTSELIFDSNRKYLLKKDTYTISDSNKIKIDNKSNIIIDFNFATLTQSEQDINIIEISNCSNIVIKNLIIRGIKGTLIGINGFNKGITIANSNNIVIENSDIQNMWNNGVYTYNVNGFKLIKSTIKNIGDRNTSLNNPYNTVNFVPGSFSCVYLHSTNVARSKNIIVENNTIGGCLNTIVSCVASDNTIIRNNYIIDGDSNGIQVGTSISSCIIENNIIDGATGFYDVTTEGYGISIHSNGDGSIIRNNIIRNYKRAAISTKATNDCLIESNIIDNCTQAKNFNNITFWGDNVKCVNNVIYNCEFTPISCSGTNCTIEGNIIERKEGNTSVLTGIYFGTSYNENADNCTIKNNKSKTVGLVISVMKNCYIEDNRGFSLYGNNFNGVVCNQYINSHIKDGYSIRLLGDEYIAKFINVNRQSTLQNNGAGIVYNDLKRELSSSPLNNVKPNFLGEEILDTSTKIWWKSVGFNNWDWKALNS